MKALWTFLVSRNTAIVLLIAVSLVLIIGAALPNPSLMPPAAVEALQGDHPFLFWMGDHFNSMKIGRSPVFGAIGVLLIISTLFCSIDRVIKKIKKEPTDYASLLSAFQGTAATIDAAEDAEGRLITILRRNRWSIETADSASGRVVSAAKGDIGFWGSVFFHGVLITLIGGLAVFHFSGFYATAVITEGQTLRLTRENLTQIERTPLFGMDLPDLVFTLNKFETRYYDESTAVDYTMDFDVAEERSGRSWKQIIKVNEPLRYGGTEYLVTRQGYSPNFLLLKDNKPIFDSYVALKLDDESKDIVEIPGEGLVITAQFFPDLARTPGGKVYSKGPRPRNPHFGLDISQRGRKIYRGLVKEGEGVSFGAYRLEFRDLRHWVTLDLTRETGLGFFFWCGMAGLIGVLVRALDPERRIVALMVPGPRGRTVTFYLFSKQFEGMLREKRDEVIRQLKAGAGEGY